MVVSGHGIASPLICGAMDLKCRAGCEGRSCVKVTICSVAGILALVCTGMEFRLPSLSIAWCAKPSTVLILAQWTWHIATVPVYESGVLTLTLTRDNPADAVSCGTLLVGRQFDIGDTEHGVDLGIIDYSRKETDQFGVTSVVERAFAKRMSARVVMQTSAVDDVHRTLASIRATPVLWIGSESFESLTVFGFYKEFSIDLAYPTLSYCSLTIEGLT